MASHDPKFVHMETLKKLVSGMVVIVDGSEIEHANIVVSGENNDAIYVDNLKVHLLVIGRRFDIQTSELSFPKLKGEK